MSVHPLNDPVVLKQCASELKKQRDEALAERDRLRGEVDYITEAAARREKESWADNARLRAALRQIEQELVQPSGSPISGPRAALDIARAALEEE